MRKRYLHDSYGEDDAFWDQNWGGEWAHKCALPPPVMQRLVSRITKYLRPGMLLLEGGCGDGRYVRYFTDLGVKTVGVDFARNTVERVNGLFPSLDVRVGDIRHTGFADGYFDAYFSGGVIEHFEDGIAPQLAEARRVLKGGGYFLLTVPHMNLTRRCAAAVFRARYKLDLDGRRSYHKEGVREFILEQPPEGFHFHEYVLTSREMRRFLSAHGFRILEEMCFASPSGLCDIEVYRRLIGAGCAQRTVVNKALAVPLRLVRSAENGRSTLGRVLSDALGMVLGNLKLYVCRTDKGV